MNWKNGYEARYYCTVVDRVSWRDLQRFEVLGGSISKTEKDRMESANIELTSIPADGEIWVRVWLDARQGQDGAHEALFTGIMSVPVTNWQGRRKTHNTECYSVLQPAADVLLQRGWFAPKGWNGAMLIRQLLEVTPAPVEQAANSPTLSQNIIAEDGETCLSMSKKILDAIGWRLRITGKGIISIEPKAQEATARFDSIENDCVELSVTDKRDWFQCPNVFRATSGELVAVARNDDRSSPFSTVSRGREIWNEETNVALSEGESIEDYAARRLKEVQAPSRTVNYARRYLPDLYPGDIAHLHFPENGILGNFRIAAQRIELGYGARTAEEAEESA